MRYISFYNVKGGTAKTHSAISFAIILAKKYNKRVLFVDIDPQSSATKSLGCYNENDEEGILSIADIMLSKDNIASKAIQHCKYGFDVIPSSFDLLGANIRVSSDLLRPQQLRLKNSLSHLRMIMISVFLISLLILQSQQLMHFAFPMIFSYQLSLVNTVQTDLRML